ncbi:GHKL domain-containing protein [Paenibacillus sp. SYP-B3998]|uniref:histidine kinase n=1 Tax=Paenibacillus sp. SYP-B3998 TaxID=2678564 RepID=A0A6G3ZZ81_9BACL|nr:ATP-binding protein [Paenibacillus sp. SYP-B3998]NEW07442.1 GHKL domain-containing protein [Paenibacillus sp. SYP-B3998]
MQTFIKNEKLQIFVIALSAAIGEGFKINPFSGDFFRIGLGVSTFLFLLLFMRHLSYIKAGILTGLVNVAFQAGDWMLLTHSFSVIESLQNNLAAGFYYVVFGFGMSRIQSRITEFHPLLLGGIVSLIDFVANGTELLVRGTLLGTTVFEFHAWFVLLITAIVRSFFVIGLYSSIAVSQMRFLHAEREKRMEQMLNIGAGLYGEAFYLKKSMDTIEEITAHSFDLYRKLKEQSLTSHSQQALGVAQQIHEVKKDSQRILAGILKLFDSKIIVDMNLSEILHFVIKGNEEYSEMLKKTIRIEKDMGDDYNIKNYIPILTILNNLVANAVEAIDLQGTIHLRIFEQDNETLFMISDDGKGIPEQDKDIIFEPGFTTKFNQEGIAATGIGLSHVRDIVRSLGGYIAVKSSEAGGAKMVVCLPTYELKKGG